jgi:hypothetical protein
MLFVIKAQFGINKKVAVEHTLNPQGNDHLFEVVYLHMIAGEHNRNTTIAIFQSILYTNIVQFVGFVIIVESILLLIHADKER